MSTASTIPAEGTKGSTIAGFVWLVVSVSLAWVFVQASNAAAGPTRLETNSRVLWEIAIWSGVMSVVAIHVSRRLRESQPRSSRGPLVLGAVAVIVVGAIRLAPTFDIVLLPTFWALAAAAIWLLEYALRTVTQGRPSIPAMVEPREPVQGQPGLSAPLVVPTAAAGSPVACPFLGLPDDAATHFMFAAPGHRCFAGSKPVKVGLPHQGSFCLSDGFAACDRFPATATATATAGVPTSTAAAEAASTIPPERGYAGALLASPIQRLRAARPGEYVPRSANRSPGSAHGRRRDGRAWVRPLIAVVIIGIIVVGAAWAIAERGSVVAG